MYIRAVREDDHWRVENAFGHALALPCPPDALGGEIRFGVLGTGTRAKVRGRKTDRMADTLAALRRPIYLLDARRNGVGGQGSWSPLEFASLIPAAIDGPYPYAFVHLPCVAPSHGLVDTWHGGRLANWREFRNLYNAELSAASVEVARAFVETAATAGGLAIFLCAEPDAPDFDTCSLEEQNELYCHRFALARRVADRLREAHPAAEVRLMCLDIGADPRIVTLAGK